MTNLRQVLTFIAVTLLAAFTLSANAATDKSFTLTPQASIPLGTSNAQFTFTNIGQSSNPNSVEIDVVDVIPPGSGSLTFNNSGSIVTNGYSGTFVWVSATKIQFINISPSVNKKPFKVQVSVTASSSSCRPSNVEWVAYMWTGAPSTPSQSLQLVDSNGNAIPTAAPYPTSTIPAGAPSCVSCPSIDSTCTPSNPGGCGLSGPNTSGLRLDNKNLSACQPIQYTLDVNLNARTVFLGWETLIQPAAAFVLTTTFSPSFVDTDGLPKDLLIAWQLIGDPPVPDYKVARTCLSQDPPAMYGRVSAFNGTNVVTVDNTTNPPSGGFVALPQGINFPWLIGTERMTANCSLNVCTVTRPAGHYGTEPVDLAAAATNHTPVVSNPLPLDENLKQMQGCIVDETFLGSDLCTPTDPTKACTTLKATLFIFGDYSALWP